MMRTPDRLRGIGGAKRAREVYIREVATEASFISALYRHLIPMDRKAIQREQEKKEKEGLSDTKKKRSSILDVIHLPGVRKLFSHYLGVNCGLCHLGKEFPNDDNMETLEWGFVCHPFMR